MNNIEEYTQKEFDNAKAILYDNFILNLEKVQKPKAIILGGQPGAGKSLLHRIYKKKFNQNIAIINGDDYRKYHPHIKELINIYGDDYVSKTAKFSGEMTEALFNKLSDNRYNIIIEGTLRTTDVPLKTARLLIDKGYDVELAIIAVKPEISYLSTVKRFEDMLDKGLISRATPKKHHDQVVNNIIDNLDKINKANIFNNIIIYTRDEKCIFNKITDNYNPSEILKNKILGEWNQNELFELKRIIKSIKELKMKRHDPKLNEFSTEVRGLMLKVNLKYNKDKSLQLKFEKNSRNDR